MKHFLTALGLAITLLATSQAQAGVAEAIDAHFAGEYAKALAELRPLAEQGNAAAQTHLGVMYAAGHGVEKNEATAVAWYRKAAQQGDSNGQYALGIMYAQGRGIARDEQQAVHWMRLAAEQGHIDAMYDLSLMFLEGRGTTQNKAVAYALQNLSGVNWEDVATRNKIGKSAKEITELSKAKKLAAAMKPAGKMREALDSYLLKAQVKIKK